MRKKLVYLFVLSLSVLLFGCSKKPEETADIPDTSYSETITETASEAETENETVKETKTETETIIETETTSEPITEAQIPTEEDTNLSDTSELDFYDLADMQFYFSSGAGGWSTELDIMSDGTFSGYYHDSEASSTGQDYPHGTLYECYFSGTFTSLKKVGAYEYSMECESLITEGTLGEEKIQDNIRYFILNHLDFHL